MEALKQRAIESLKKQFNASGEMEKIIINNCLLPTISNDPLFAERILVEGKTINDMRKKIMDWVKKSENYSPSHNVIFSLAIHYFQEDKPGYIEELHKEDPMEFGNIEKEFNTPMIKYITGTVIKEVIKEVIKNPKPSDTSDLTKNDNITKKVSKTIKANSKNISQVDIFEVLENEDQQ